MPTLKIDVAVEGTKLLVEGMERGDYDIIFGIDPVIGETFRSFVTCVLEMVWAGSPDVIDVGRTYSVDDLARMPIVTFPRDSPPYRQIAPTSRTSACWPRRSPVPTRFSRSST